MPASRRKVTALIPFGPEPSRNLLARGWCDYTFVPWLEEQIETPTLIEVGAGLDGLIAKYKALGVDVFELLKARRRLELHLGELLGPVKERQRTDLQARLSDAHDSLSRDDRHRFRTYASRKDRVIAYLDAAQDAEELSGRAVYRAAIGHSIGHHHRFAGSAEWYSPEPHVEAARTVMGSIALDPASTETANSVVRAKRFYSVKDDGLSKRWRAPTLWMNPPWDRPVLDQFIEKLVHHHGRHDVGQAIVLVCNSTETPWCQSLMGASSALCFPLRRVHYWRPDMPTSSALRGQLIAYLGTEVQRFRKEFGVFGVTVRT